MQYLGSKRLTGKRIIDYIFSHVTGKMPFVEPFAGALNFTNHVAKRMDFPLLNDSFQVSEIHLNEYNEYVVALIMAYKSGWTIYDFKHPDFKELPCEKYGHDIKGNRISEVLYNDIKRNPDKYPPEVVGFCGVGLSFGNKFMGGYARQSEGWTNYTSQFHNSIIKDISCWNKWDNIQVGCYTQMVLPPPPAVIYCDPPYRKTEKSYKIEKLYEVKQ